MANDFQLGHGCERGACEPRPSCPAPGPKTSFEPDVRRAARQAAPARGLYVEELGTAYNGELVKVIFELDDLELSAAQREDLMDSVLASFAWA